MFCCHSWNCSSTFSAGSVELKISLHKQNCYLKNVLQLVKRLLILHCKLFLTGKFKTFSGKGFSVNFTYVQYKSQLPLRLDTAVCG